MLLDEGLYYNPQERLWKGPTSTPMALPEALHPGGNVKQTRKEPALTSHAGSRTLYMQTVFSVNQLPSIPACHFIRICIFPPINMSLVMESDALYWLNWAYFVYGMHFFGGCISLFMSHRASREMRWQGDRRRKCDGELHQKRRKSKKKKKAHVCKNTVQRKRLLWFYSTISQNSTVYSVFLHTFPHTF